MNTEALPSSWTRPDTIAPCRPSGGASRKYRPLSSYVDNAGLVLAGLNIVTPAVVMASMTVSVTLEEAAPMMASTPSPSRRVEVTVAVSVDVSPESPCVYSTGLPSTPPALLISSIAYSTPANSGGPRNARLPVSGSNEPILRTPSPARSAVTGTSDTIDDSGESAVTNCWSSEIRLWAPNWRIAYEPLRGSPLPLKSSGPDTPS